MASLFAFAATSCSNDDDVVIEQVTGPTEVNVISCAITSDDSKQTGDIAWKKRRTAVIELVNQQNPDIFCTQGQLWNQTVYLQQQLTSYSSVDYNVNGNDSSTGLHNTIMFRSDKYSLLNQGRYWLSQKPTSASYPWASKDENRRCTAWALLKDNNTHAKFIVMCTQVNDGDEPEDDEARLNSANLNIAQMKEIMGSEKIPVIFAGNLNASTDADDSRKESLDPYFSNLTDARTNAASTDGKATFNGFGDTSSATRLTTDYILLYEASPLSFKTLDAQYGSIYLSDHNPISCKIKF